MDNKKTYSLKEKKLTGNYDIKTITLANGNALGAKTPNGKKIILSKCSSCNKKKSTFVKSN